MIAPPPPPGSSEADARGCPRFKATAFGTLSPEINCLDAACTATDPQNFAWRFEGLFGSAQLDVTQPLYTFGKIDHARAAARAGLDAQRALADEAAGDLAVDAARAYWGLKLARELGYMLDDGIDEIGKALARMNGERDGEPPRSRSRIASAIAVLLAEAKVQRADATHGRAAGARRAARADRRSTMPTSTTTSSPRSRARCPRRRAAQRRPAGASPPARARAPPSELAAFATQPTTSPTSRWSAAR